MRLTFWGVRGSYPVSRPDMVRYGGNSTCIHVQTGDEHWILDAGSGLRSLGQQLMEGPFGLGQGFARFLVTHTHWDHILGFPFFQPLYVPGNRFEVWSADPQIEGILEGQQHRDNFPVPFHAFKAQLSFHHLPPGGQLEVDEVVVRTAQTNHPGVTLGYRIEEPGASAVVITDTARIEAVQQGDDMLVGQAFTDSLIDLCAEADLLVHDAHFTEAGIVGKEHWGHSTPADAVRRARDAGVSILALFHHAPEHPDAIVDKQLLHATALAGPQLDVIAARERHTLSWGEP